MPGRGGGSRLHCSALRLNQFSPYKTFPAWGSGRVRAPSTAVGGYWGGAGAGHERSGAAGAELGEARAGWESRGAQSGAVGVGRRARAGALRERAGAQGRGGALSLACGSARPARDGASSAFSAFAPAASCCSLGRDPESH